MQTTYSWYKTKNADIFQRDLADEVCDQYQIMKIEQQKEAISKTKMALSIERPHYS